MSKKQKLRQYTRNEIPKPSHSPSVGTKKPICFCKRFQCKAEEKGHGHRVTEGTVQRRRQPWFPVPTTICAFAGRRETPSPHTTVEHGRHLTCHCGFCRRPGVGFPLILRRYTITWKLAGEGALNGKACWTFTSPLSIVSLHRSLSGKLWSGSRPSLPGLASLKLTYLIPVSSWKFSMKNR